MERTEQLSALDSALSGSSRGTSRLAIVDGPVATGKTSLLEAFVERATSRGALVLGARASHVERSLPLGVIGQLLDTREVPAATAEHAARLLNDGTAFLMVRETPAAAQAKTIALHELCVELLDLARRRPLVICVDDVHNADPDSLACLLLLIHRMKSSRVMVVLTEAPQIQRSEPSFHAELRRLHPFDRLRLRPLSRPGALSVLEAHLGQAVARRLEGPAYEVSGGNPLLLRALIEDYRYGSKNDSELVVGATFGQSLVGCLYQCESTILDIARGLAVIGSTATPAVLAKLLGVAADTVAQAIRMLNDAGLLDGAAFRHHDARMAILRDMSPRDRAALHASVAGLLHTEGAPSVVVARHLTYAERVDEPYVVPALLEATEQALLAGEITIALRFLRLAQKQTTDPHQQATITAQIACSEWQLEPRTATRHVSQLRAAARADRLGVRCALRLVALLLWYGRTAEAGQELDRLDRARARLGTEDAADLYTVRTWASFLFPDDITPAEDTGQMAEAAPSPRRQAAGTLTAVLQNRAGDDALDRVDNVLTLLRDEPGVGCETNAMSALALLYSDRADEAAPLCEPLPRLLPAESATKRAWCEALRAVIDVRRGEMAGAERHAAAALAGMANDSWGVFGGLPVAAMVTALTAMGRDEEAAEFLRVPTPEVLYRSLVGLHYLQARGHHFLATGRYETALHDFQTCGELMQTWKLDLPAIVPWRTEAARAHLGLGNPKAAMDLAREELSRLKPGPSRCRGLALRVLAAASPATERAVLLCEAAEAHRQGGDRLEYAYTLAEIARGRCGTDDSGLREARRLARLCGVEDIERGLLAGYGPPPAAPRAAADLDCGRLTEAANGSSAAPALPGAPQAGAGHAAASETASKSASKRSTRKASTVGSGAPSRAVASSGRDPRNGLTDAERRVAALAAHGYSNRQIARELFITVSTVEQHLTRVYRKLNVGRRAELAAGFDFGIADSA
ncbi:helix-turn-helix transcriptional regulator [Actinomadura opuntiae]|uniref:helix-turn-helix transcriptional regulator n=1 Tax=Actinomadura sp. OS1-43 TaxID=604315 RepID=UPI00255A8957|nr:LuxR family transcriptional regulator [Actinomadura sp. OS1-43]MDL4815414.1 LuxR family transcriptional regulator [Actinomadura sp. OS1-43]